MKIFIATLVSSVLFSVLSCGFGAGTLGGGEVYKFNCKRHILEKALDTLNILNPKFNVPKRWRRYNNWEEKGYGFLNGKTYYIKGNDELIEEMYYVSTIGSDTISENYGHVTIRSVFRMVNEQPRWLYFTDIDESDAEFIEKRFRKIILDRITALNCGCNKYENIPWDGNGD